MFDVVIGEERVGVVQGVAEAIEHTVLLLPRVLVQALPSWQSKLVVVLRVFLNASLIAIVEFSEIGFLLRRHVGIQSVPARDARSYSNLVDRMIWRAFTEVEL